MKILNELPIIPFLALVFTLVLTPAIRKFAQKINLVDKPNARKVHNTPVPLIGGIVVFISSSVAMLLCPGIFAKNDQLYAIVVGAFILLFMGVIDDKIDIRASYKLFIQLALSHFAFTSGIKIDSFFGVFGIYALPEFISYIVTLVVIAGVVNAFNLTDGIDGLAAGMAIVGFAAFAILAWMLDSGIYFTLFLTIIGALLGFLRHNLSKTKKIFMGDAGSLFLGFILVTSGIILIQTSQHTERLSTTCLTVISVLIIPVADSLRVYRSRIKEGYSPFRADKTHLHHLMLHFGIKHKAASALIVSFAAGLILIAVFTGSYFSLTFTLLALIGIFIIISSILSLNKEVSTWLERIKNMEK